MLIYTMDWLGGECWIWLGTQYDVTCLCSFIFRDCEIQRKNVNGYRSDNASVMIDNPQLLSYIREVQPNVYDFQGLVVSVT